MLSIPSHQLVLQDVVEQALIAGARDSSPVRGLTHDFYKYPARFSPSFARAAILAFTEPGDLCFDPHVGGGTTLVEAMALGRRGIGVDVSSLASFVSQVKTTLLSDQSLTTLATWSREASTAINMQQPSQPIAEYSDLGYYKHLNHPDRWRLRKAIEQAIESAISLRDDALVAFARCAVLRTAQWALDGRRSTPSVESFRVRLRETTLDMVEGARSLRKLTSTHGVNATAEIFHRSAAGLESDERTKTWTAPRLILTSPPYPGIHVLYHRWQVDGRKESAVPFMIAGRLDGSGASYYTMGDRKTAGLASYFAGVQSTMSSAATLSRPDALFVQVLAFSEPSWQLPRYLATMESCGLQEVTLSSLSGEGDGRLWRTVPNRKWYAVGRREFPGGHEVVLFHRKASATTA